MVRERIGRELQRFIIHEVKNCSVVMQGQLFKVKKHLKNSGGCEDVAGRMRGIENTLEDMLSLLTALNANSIGSRNRDMDMPAILRKVVETHSASDCSFSFLSGVPHDGYRVKGNDALVKIAFNNIVLNAVQAGASRIQIATGVKKTRDRLLYFVKISDNGRQSGKKEKNKYSFGLGLKAVRHIVSKHSGTMSIRQNKGRGTIVAVGFPASRKMAEV